MVDDFKFCVGCGYPIKFSENDTWVCDCPLWDYLTGDIPDLSQVDPESSFLGAKDETANENTQEIDFAEITKIRSDLIGETVPETKKSIPLKKNGGD